MSKRRRYRNLRGITSPKAFAGKGGKPAPDLEIEVDTADPVQAKALDAVLREAKEAGVEVSTKTYKSNEPLTDTIMYGQPYRVRDGKPDEHYIGRAMKGDHMIAKSLLNIAGYKSHAGPLAPPLEHDDRPLIDLLHEATFTDAPGLGWIEDKYALRAVIRKAHCFTLNDATSTLVADFSIAVASDLEATRQMAIPPFPVTWIDFDNQARLKRMKELGVQLTPTAAGLTDAGPAVERVGWLIHSDMINGGYYAHYVTSVTEGVCMAPLAFWWHTDEPRNAFQRNESTDYYQWLAFGIKDPNVGPSDAYPANTPMHSDDVTYAHKRPSEARLIMELMQELAGELRHIWGFLIALGAGHLGASAQYTSQALPTRSPPIMKNGKPLLPLEHKVLHLHLNKKTPAKIVAQAITHHHNRRHDVRAHWRQLKSGKRVPVRSHQRGDELLGRIEKTYYVER